MPNNKYSKIEKMIFDIENYGERKLKTHKLTPFNYYELVRCYDEIKQKGKTTTLISDVKNIFKTIKNIRIKTSSKRIDFLIIDEGF